MSKYFYYLLIHFVALSINYIELSSIITMKTHSLAILSLIFLFCISPNLGLGQGGSKVPTSSIEHNWSSYFQKAYSENPVLPQGILEGLAYSNSRMENLTSTEVEEHDQPTRLGIFGLIENGGGYFRENLKAVCEFNKINSEDFKKNIPLQIQAVGKYLAHLAALKSVTKENSIEAFAPILEDFSEIPFDNSTANTYARASYAYDVFYHLRHGFQTSVLTFKPIEIELEKAFEGNMLRKLQAPNLEIKVGSTINSSAKMMGTGGDNGVFYTNSVDYPLALFDEAATTHIFSRSGAAISAISIHTMQGSYSGTISWFNNPNQILSNGTLVNVAAHYLVRSSDGQITQMVYENNMCYHTASNNTYTIGIEHEGYISSSSWYTSNMYAASAALVKDICTDRGISPTTCYNGPSCTGSSSACALSSSIKIKGHQHFTGQTHSDPGIYWNWYTYYNLINAPSIPATPSLISPSSGSTVSTTTSASFSWSSVTGATNYRLIVSTSPSGFSTANGLTTGVVYNGTTSSTSISLSGLSANTTYYWTVRAGNTAGGSPYASYRYFNTASTSGGGTGSCGDPFESNNTISSAYNMGSNTSWSSSLACLVANDYDYYRFTYNGSTYYFYVKGFNSSVTGNYGIGYNINGSTLTVSTFSVGGSTTDTWLYLLNSSGSVLKDNDDYSGNFSQVSYTLSGGSSTTCNAPTGLYYSNLSNSSVTCYWTNPTGLASTDFYYSWDNVNWNYLQNIASTYNGITLNISGSSGNNFYWRVRANCTNGYISPYSSTNYFYIPYISGGGGNSQNPILRDNNDLPTATIMRNAAIVTPNPNSGKFNLSYWGDKEGYIKVSIFDMTGKELQNDYTFDAKEGKNEFSLDLHLTSGIYFLNITEESGRVQTSKIEIMQ